MDRSKSKRSFAQLERDAASQDQAVRGSAMQELSLLVRKDAKVHDAVLRIFRKALEHPQDGWTALSAGRGYEQIVGPDEARSMWLGLLRCGNVEVVSSVALSMRDGSYAPALLELLLPQAPNVEIKTAAMRALGRMHDLSALPALLGQLDHAELRAHAIEALADLGDPRAVPHLLPFLTDTTEAWREENHGPMLRICDLAQAAIKRLEASIDPPTT